MPQAPRFAPPLRARARKGGRPAQITLDVVKAIGELVAVGMPERSACYAMTPPVNYDSFRAARRRNPLLGLVIEQAQAEFMFRALRIIQVDGTGSTGYRWILERRHAEDFAVKAVRRIVSG